MRTTTPRRNLALLGATFLLAVGLTACGDDDDSAADTPESTTTAPAETSTTAPDTESETESETEAASETEADTEGGTGTGAGTGSEGGSAADPDAPVIEVHAVDYGFENLPETVAAGTRLSLVNHGQEPHELIAIRIPDSETRPVSELVQLSEAEMATVFGEDMAPALVLLAATGQTDVPGAVVGDGTLNEPGRYAIVCFLPVGSDDSILEADGPPEGAEAPPHASQGMWAEITVQ